MRNAAKVWVLTTALCVVIFGCDKIMGGGGDAPAQPAPVAATPAQPATAVPGQPAAAVPGQPAAVPAQPAAPAAPVAPTPTGDALTDRLNAKRFEVAPEAKATSALIKQTLQKDKPQSYQVQLSGPPYCQTIVATAADGVKNIDIKLESPAGAQEAADSTEENIAVIANHCPQMPGAYKLTVEIPGGEGEFAVQVFSK